MLRRWALIAGCWLAACGGGGEAVRDGVDPVLKARHPASRYFRGEGFSTRGPSAAEVDARAKVSAQIDSTLESAVEVTATSAGGVERETARSEVRQRTRFEHAELIRIPAGATQCRGDRCWSLAVLDRSEAVDVLRREYDARRPAFRESVDAALASEDPSAFTVHFRRARKAFRELATRGRQLEVIGGRPFEPLAADRARLETLQTHRERLLAGLGVTLRLDGLPSDELRARLTPVLVAAFAEIGLSAAPGDICRSPLEFRPAAAVACGLGPLGPRCELSLDGRLRRCADGRELTALAAQFVGAHPRSEQDARRRLLERLSGEALVGQLRQHLDDVLPIHD